ncbi:MAG: glycosyltransferase family 2 protein [Pseudomonadota bacterium]
MPRTPNTYRRAPRPLRPTGFEDAPTRFEDLLVERGDVSADELFRAIVLQHRGKAPLSELLQSMGLASEEDVLGAKAEVATIPVVDLLRQPPSLGLTDGIDPRLMLQRRFVPWRRQGDALVVAVADCDDREDLLPHLKPLAKDIRFVLAKRQEIERLIRDTCAAELSEMANVAVPVQLSCRNWSTRPTRMIGLISAGVVTFWLLASPHSLALTLFVWIAAALLLNGVFKITALLAATYRQKQAKPFARPAKLPRISVMIPLLREKDILDRLIKRIERLDYPRELLEVALIYEANDPDTKAHLAQATLPAWMRAIEVPEARLQTKPRALNYALDFLSGDIVGIYDAEDAPEPDQLFQVVRRFASGGENAACVQCALDYYNAGTNWISRCFSIEYAILFRVILPGLERLNLPIPLGGTSVFFRRDILEKLGRWDAQNVTEDADLGFRLYRQGYRCLISDSTTYEEANFRVLPWVRQRSRWLKGFLQTWATHMRNPRAALRDFGIAGFMVCQAQMLGTFTSFLIAPIVLPMWLMVGGLKPAIYAGLPPALLACLIVGFVLTELFLLILGIVALGRRPGRGLTAWVLAMPLYLLLGAIAALKAAYEVFAKPSYWDKTEHGINDTVFQSEIERLTTRPDTSNSTAVGAEIDTGG